MKLLNCQSLFFLDILEFRMVKLCEYPFFLMKMLEYPLCYAIYTISYDAQFMHQDITTSYIPFLCIGFSIRHDC